MRITAIYLILAITFSVTAACGSGGDNDAATSNGDNPGASPAPVANDPATASGEPAAAVPDVSRTREGNGGIIAVAGELTTEFDYASPQGRCKASAGKFVARGIGIDDATTDVSINYETIFAPGTSDVVGQALLLEIRLDGNLSWITHVGTGLAGSVDEISQDVSPGGITLTVTGVMSGFQKNGAPTGVRAPFRLEATCDS